MLFLNWRVARRYARVRQLSVGRPHYKPRRLAWGWWMNTAATCIAFIPNIIEWRIFVQDPRWLFLYGFTATLSISGLLLINSGLGKELRQLRATKPRRQSGVKAVDTKGTDTI
jgi:hypothetical protein